MNFAVGNVSDNQITLLYLGKALSQFRFQLTIRTKEANSDANVEHALNKVSQFALGNMEE